MRLHYIKGRIGEPIAIKIVFGWILVGSDINVNCNFENFKNINVMASLAKWLSVRLRTKWLWVQVQLQSLDANVYCNFTTNFDDLNKNICKLWEIKSYGTLLKFALLPHYDQRALEILENRTAISKSSFYGKMSYDVYLTTKT